MKIAIDARPAVFPHRTGIGHYTRQMIRLLPRVDPGVDYIAWYLNASDLGRSRRHFDRSKISNLAERGTPIPARWFDRLSRRFDLPRVEWLVRFDVFFAPNFVPPPTRSRNVVTVHDLAFRMFPETAPQSTRWWLSRVDRALGEASRVIAVSQCTKRDLMEIYGVPENRIEVIPHGVNREVFRPPAPQDVGTVRRRLGLAGPYLLYLGGIEPRKNLPRLVSAFAGLPATIRPTLVIAGGGVEWNPEGPAVLRSALRNIPEQARSKVILTGYLAERDKVALLGGADALVYPSRYEGFGLPVLEAMACGTPVLTSNVSALPEIAGDAAVLVDPENVRAIAEGIERLVTDEELRERLRVRGLARAAAFSWEETARMTAAALHRTN
jgi:glycosyltransferase involved in cell wall biosynthesis